MLKKYCLLLELVGIGFLPVFSQTLGLPAGHRKHSRVVAAFSEKKSILENLLSEKALKVSTLRLLIVVLKEKDTIYVYARNREDLRYRFLKAYRICSRSGVLGPKCRQGDFQVPEGFYHIQIFNPSSQYYLSLGINYPNLADKRRCSRPPYGGDIFIHGKCVTIGCIPIEDEGIKELYMLCLYSLESGQKNIPVYIFPFEMKEENIRKYENDFPESVIGFWKNIQKGYELFFDTFKEIQFTVDREGGYVFLNSPK